MDVPAIEVPSVAIPAFSHFYNLAVFPASWKAQGKSLFFLMKNAAGVPKPSGKKLWVEYIPDSIYCLFPSTESEQGSVTMYSSKPAFLDDFSSCLELNVYEFSEPPTKSSDQIPASEGCKRCVKCFVDHFPKPNTKICKLNKARMPPNSCVESKVVKSESIDTIKLDENTVKLLLKHITFLESVVRLKEKSETKRPRLRGGVGNIVGYESPLISKAIMSAKKHGINLVPGIMNDADGNCAFDSVINNINNRDCFNENLPLSTSTYRQIWMTELEMESDNFPTLGAGYTAEEKSENWNLLKQSGVYEIDFFGDMVMHGIAIGCHKNILIFNTSVEAAYPIYVIQATEFGGFVDSEVPVVLGYNQVHYESLHPATQEDIELTKTLVNSFVSGSYTFTREDIPFLTNLVETEGEENQTKSGQKTKACQNVVAQLKTVQKKKENIKEKKKKKGTQQQFSQWSLDELKSVKRKDRTKDQQKAYNRLMMEKSRTKQTPKQKIKIAEEDARRKKANWKQLSDEDRSAYNQKDARRKKANFDQLSDEDRSAYNKKTARRMKANFDQLSDEDRSAYNQKDARRKKANFDQLSDEDRFAHNQEKASNMKANRIKSKDNPQLKGVARRFTIDQPYFHDIIESFEGPLKVWSKGEKLEHDSLWQKVMAERYAKRLSEAYNADIITGMKNGFLNYVLEPQSQGYEENEWTEFVKKMNKIPRKHWIDEVYTVITNAKEVAENNESKNEKISQDLLDKTKQIRQSKDVYIKPIFKKGPVCQCYARKFFLEINYLGCCLTGFKKFLNKDMNKENENYKATSKENETVCDDGDIDEALINEVQLDDDKDDIDQLLESSKKTKEKKLKKQISLKCTNVPDELMSLYQGVGSDGKFFISHANSLNQALSFCSLGADFQRWDGSRFVNEKKATSRGFNPIVTVQGKMFHRIGPIKAAENNEPKFGQIYFIDADLSEQADQRIKNVKTFNVSTDQNVRFNPQAKKILVTLQEYLLENYPYIDAFKTCLEIMKEEDKEQSYSVVLKADKKISDEKKIHSRNSNLPLCSEVAILVPIGQKINNLDIRLFTKSGEIRRIPLQNCHYDTLMYPLLHLNGEGGWNHIMTKLTPLKHYKYVMQLREEPWIDNEAPEERKNIFNSKLQTGKLSQIYALDIDNKIQTINLNYIKSPAAQKMFKTNSYQGLVDELSGVDTDEKSATVFLPSSIRGSPRYYDRCYQETLAIGAEYGTPDIFLTFTANPNWLEITQFSDNELHKQQRADIIARVFRLKTKRLIDTVNKSMVFGTVKAHSCSEEEQKRALPHIHLLLWLKKADKILTPEMADSVFMAEFPDIQLDPSLFEIVRKNMVHGPCGVINNKSPCMDNGKCTKHYPKENIDHTVFTEKGGTLFRRRIDNRFAQLPNYKATNNWIVPYSAFMLLKFKAHINLEMVRSMFSNIKYLYKYIYKGSDVALMKLKMEETDDEVETYECLRYVNATRAFYNIYSFPIQERFPSVMTLPVHEENKQRVVCLPGLEAARVANPPTSPLLAYFQECQNENAKANELRYCEMPLHYTWKGSSTDGRWQPRQRGFGDQIGRVPYRMLNPHNHEYFYMRTLLNVRIGVKGFIDLRTVPDDKNENETYVCINYKEACQKLGLYHDDSEWDKVMEEASFWGFPKPLRMLAANILLYNRPVNPLSFLETHQEILVEDYVRTNKKATTKECHEWLLTELKKILETASSNLKHVGLPEPDRIKRTSQAFVHEYSWDSKVLEIELESTLPNLTIQQKSIFEKTTKSVLKEDGQLYFIDAPGGCGKSFTANCIMNFLRHSNLLVLACASSGIAATVLMGGSTAHNKFQIPVELNEESLCDVREGTDRFKLIKATKLVIWDEAPMMHRYGINAVDRMFQRVKCNNKPFGGVTFVFMGDWRQTLAVVPLSSKEQKLAATLLFADCWKHVQVLNLTENMRIQKHGGNLEWAEYLLAVGEGKLPVEVINGIEYTKLPKSLMVESGKVLDLIDSVYPSLKTNFQDKLWLYNRAIICPRNDDVNEINKFMLDLLPGTAHKFYSIDQVNDQDARAPMEVINKLNPQGMPLHEISLKIGAVIMLLRNLNPAEGHCNGSRYIVTNLAKHVIEAVIPDGLHKGKILFIPRIFNTPPKNFHPHMTRIQFPIKLAFAITSNKSQGQSLESIGIYLNAGFFDHGQRYTAESRCGNPSNVKVLIKHNPTGGNYIKDVGNGEKEFYTSNIVYKEIFSLAKNN